MKQSDIVKKIRKLGYKVTVLNASTRNRGGIPDILISYEGHPVFVEIKVDNDKLSKLQENFRDEFLGGWACLKYDSKTKSFSGVVWRSALYPFITTLTKKLNAN
jgi:hypothetical protein